MKKPKIERHNNVKKTDGMVKIPVYSSIKVVNGELIGVTESGIEKPLEWFDNNNGREN